MPTNDPVLIYFFRLTISLTSEQSWRIKFVYTTTIKSPCLTYFFKFCLLKSGFYFVIVTTTFSFNLFEANVLLIQKQFSVCL